MIWYVKHCLSWCALFVLLATFKTICSHDLNTLINYAHAIEQSGDIACASQIYSRLVEHYPTCTQAWYNLAHTYKDLHLIDQAIQAYLNVLEQDPEHTFARFGLGQCYGSLYTFEKAWPLLESRGTAIKEFASHIEYVKKLYASNQSLQGMRILLRAEWGLGDNLQFIRYAQLLHDRGAYIIMHSYPQLQQLFKLCPYLNQVISAGDAFPDHHVQIPLLSLPYVCSITQHTCTPTMPYLKAHPDLTQQWRAYLAAYQSFTIGICWKGNGDQHAPPLLNKNILIQELAVLNQISGISLFSLQQKESEIPTIPNLASFDDSFDRDHGRFMDTAALMNSLDLVITIDTSIAHLAGALNRPVWLLLPYHCDWRWGTNEDTSPFYPSMRIFRQKKPGDWQSVMHEIVIELRKMTQSLAPQHPSLHFCSSKNTQDERSKATH